MVSAVSGCTQKNDGETDWEPLRVAKDGCGLPTVSNTVDELAVMMAGLASEKDDDWIWDAMTKNPDLVEVSIDLIRHASRQEKGKSS